MLSFIFWAVYCVVELSAIDRGVGPESALPTRHHPWSFHRDKHRVERCIPLRLCLSKLNARLVTMFPLSLRNVAHIP
jgi:hypothetical protein